MNKKYVFSNDLKFSAIQLNKIAKTDGKEVKVNWNSELCDINDKLTDDTFIFSLQFELHNVIVNAHFIKKKELIKKKV